MSQAPLTTPSPAGARPAPAARAVELRSDTFTLPTPAMLQAIAAAELGDECYREDPTVRALEAQAAARVGKQAAVLMPSGSMANLAALLAHCLGRPEPSVLVGDQSDIWVYEDGSVARWAGIRLLPLATGCDGKLALAELEAQCRAEAGRVALIALENPHNLRGGVVLPAGYVSEVAALARAHGARLHLDGARLFNAATALGVEPAEVAREADSLQFCLSKGLAAPMGSMVAGTREFVERVRAARKTLGGDLHQAGILAAAGLVALRDMPARLALDHAHARRLAEGLAGLPGLELDLPSVQTNTVAFGVTGGDAARDALIAALDARGVRISPFGAGRARAVLHHGVSEADVDAAVAAFVEALGSRA